jgi:hypothetical protein
MNKNEIVVTATAVGAKVVANYYACSLTVNILQINYKNYIIVHNL